MESHLFHRKHILVPTVLPRWFHISNVLCLDPKNLVYLSGLKTKASKSRLVVFSVIHVQGVNWRKGKKKLPNSSCPFKNYPECVKK